MKKKVLLFGALFISLLLISSVTAVPSSQSKPVMNLVDCVDQEQKKLDRFSEQLPNGIFDLIWQLIQVLFQLIMRIIDIVTLVSGIITSIQILIETIQVLMQLIQDFLDILSNLLNPEEMFI